MLRRRRHLLLALGVLLAGAAIAPSAGAASVPYPAPTGTLPQFHDPLLLDWKWGPTTTKLLSAQVNTAGPDVTMVALYLRPGHKHPTLVWQMIADGKTEITDALAKLERKTYKVGYRLELTLAAPDTLPQQALFTFRRNRIPSVRTSFPSP
jgi:hypothetical protein